MNGRTLLVFNPASGHNRRHPTFAKSLADFAQRNSDSVKLIATIAPRQATELARAAVADGYSCVAAIGGDGTVNEVAQGLIGSAVALGLVPCGSGNGLARHLGISLNTKRALADLVSPDRRVIRVDTGTANGHPFVNVMGCGFDAELSWRFNQLKRRGLAAYALTTLKAYLSAPINRYSIRTGEIEKTLDALLVSVANSSQYGNNALIAPAARVDDGKLDLVAVQRLGLGVLAFGARLFSGTIDRSTRVQHLQQAEFTIERAQDGLIHTDGECHETSAFVQVKTVPLSLAVILAPLADNRGIRY